jgi:hypothetical protein
MSNLRKALVWVLTVVSLLDILLAVPVSASITPAQPQTGISPPGTIISSQMLNALGAKLQLPKIAQDAINRGVKPAALQNVDCTLEQNVEVLSDQATQSIKSSVNNGIVDVGRLSGITPDEGKIYVDKVSGAALQFVKGTDNKTYLYSAEQDNLVKEIYIPDQTVHLNDANISSKNENVDVLAVSTQSTSDNATAMYVINFDETRQCTGIDETTKNTVGVKLKGSLTINAPTMDAMYTKWDGYKFIYHAGESADVSASLFMDIKSEVKIPLMGFDIPSDICGVTVGVFLVVGVDGQITIDYSFEQHYNITAGVQGGTFCYVPTSLDGVLNQDFGFNSDGVKISGKIKGDIYVSAEVALRILGKVSIGINARLGIALEVKLDEGAADSFKAKADGYFSINARVKIFSKDWKKELYSYHFLLFEKTQKPNPEYIITIDQACVYGDIIKGRVVRRTAS